MAFQTPFEIAQSQLEKLRISSVDAREAIGMIFPFFDAAGVTRFLVLDTQGGERPGSPGGLWVVDEFPLEIRLRKAIYPRPIVNYRSLADLDPGELAGLYHFDVRRQLESQAALKPECSAHVAAGNIATRVRGRELIRDLFYTLDLRRLTGGVSRSGMFLKRRMEMAGLKVFLESTAPTTA